MSVRREASYEPQATQSVTDGISTLGSSRRVWQRPARGAAYWAISRAAVPVGIITAWVAVSYAEVIDPIFLPTPSDLWTAFEGMRPVLPGALASSVTMTLSGFVIGTALGIGLGLLMAYSKIAREFLGGVLDFIRPVPIFALIPLFVLWFGIGRLPQITLIALGTSIILGVTTIEATRNVPTLYVRAALTLGAGRERIYRKIVVPWMFPHLLGAIRVAAAASWGLDVAAEFMGAQSGLGYIMIVRQQYLDTAGIVVVVLIYSFLALGLDLIIRAAGKPLTRWTERESRHQAGIAAAMGQA